MYGNMTSKDKKHKSKSKSKSEGSTTSEKVKVVKIDTISENEKAKYKLIAVNCKDNNKYRLVVKGKTEERDRKYFGTIKDDYISSSGIQVFKDSKAIVTPSEDKYDLTKPHKEFETFSSILYTGKISMKIGDDDTTFYDYYVKFMEHVKKAVCSQAIELKNDDELTDFFNKVKASKAEDLERLVSYPQANASGFLSWSVSNFVKLVDEDSADIKFIDKKCLIGKLFKAWYILDIMVDFTTKKGESKIYINPYVSTAFIKKRQGTVPQYEFVDA